MMMNVSILVEELLLSSKSTVISKFVINIEIDNDNDKVYLGKAMATDNPKVFTIIYHRNG